MLRALMTLLGVDYEQWLALTRTAIRLDLRMASLGQAAYHRPGKSEGTTRLLIMRFVIYSIMGIMFAGLVLINKDVFLTGTLFLSYTMVMTAMLVLIDFGAVVISAEDFSILGYQPVSSRTYFFARLTNVLVYSTLLSLALGLAPIVTFFFTLGFRPILGLAALGATPLAGAATALFLVLIYTGLLRVVHPKKLRRAASYIQLMMSFLIYGGYMFVPRLMDARFIKTATLTKSIWLFLLPSTWFASYLDLAAGHWGIGEVFPALFSLLVLGFLLGNARGKLALEYSDHLSLAMASGEGVKKVAVAAGRTALVFKRGEARVVALLVRNQFKYDQKFRMAVLGILPLTVLYLFMGLRSGPLYDPFAGSTSGFSQSWMLYFAVLMFPSMLKATLTYSDSYQASWIYYATPADRTRLVQCSKNFVMAYFVVPYLIFIGVVFLYFFRNVGHVLLLLSVLAMLSHFFLQMTVFFQPMLPFSQPPRKGQRSGNFMVALMLGPLAAMALLYVFSVWIFRNLPLLLAVLAGMAVAAWLFEKALKLRIQNRTRSLEYQD
jgi:hypothetical protein